jgi:hypothetical protein
MHKCREREREREILRILVQELRKIEFQFERYGPSKLEGKMVILRGSGAYLEFTECLEGLGVKMQGLMWNLGKLQG